MGQVSKGLIALHPNLYDASMNKYLSKNLVSIKPNIHSASRASASRSASAKAFL